MFPKLYNYKIKIKSKNHQTTLKIYLPHKWKENSSKCDPMMWAFSYRDMTTECIFTISREPTTDQ